MAGSCNRFTAAQVATSKGTTSDNVVLVAGTGYADAISATTLAKHLNAPILLTEGGTNVLNSNTKTALATLKPKTVYVIGGKGVITTAINFANLRNSKVTIVGTVNLINGNVQASVNTVERVNVGKYK